MEQLDEVDIEILRRLTKDGRMSFNTIASELNISPPTVKYRVDKLKKLGFIQKFSVLIDPNKIKNGFFVLILIEAKFQKVQEIINELEKIDLIQAIYTSLDRSNIILRLFVENNEELNDFINHHLSRFRDIDKFEKLTILNIIKEVENASFLRPGFGIRVFCDLCHKEIKSDIVKKVINDREYNFCCNTCATVLKNNLKENTP